MIKNFLHIYQAIKAVINSSNSKAFKNKALILSDEELIYLKNILNICSIFVKTTTKLQAETYPTIYYIIPEVYNIYNRLNIIKKDIKISDFFNFFLKIIKSKTYINTLYRIKLLLKLLIKELQNLRNIILS